MVDIVSLEAKLKSALDRIENALSSDANAKREDLRQMLMQAQTQVAAQATQLTDLTEKFQVSQRENAQNQKAISALERGVSELRAANNALVKSNAELVNGAGGGDDALRAEVQAMRADRQAEQSEVAALLVALGPLVEEGNDDA